MFDSDKHQTLSEADVSKTFAKLNNNSAGTVLNICAILSKLNKHEQALKYAMDAINKLKLSQFLLDQKSALMREEEVKAAQLSILTTKIIAFYNMGVEQEYLFRFDEAISAYDQAFQIASA